MGEQEVESARNAHLSLLETEELSDVTFLIGPQNERVKCHKIFLSSRSPVFKAMFSAPWAPNVEENLDELEIKIVDTNVETFRVFLKFIYADIFKDDNNKLSVESVISLLQLSHKYDVQGLTSKCEQCLLERLQSKNCIQLYQTARLYGLTQLMETVEDFMADCFHAVADTEEFKRMDQETMETLLQRDDLNIPEVNLFTAVVSWAEFQCNNIDDGQSEDGSNGLRHRRNIHEMLENVIYFIRFPVMSSEEFKSIVEPTNFLPDDTMRDISKYIRTKPYSDRRGSSSFALRQILARSMPYGTTPRERLASQLSVDTDAAESSSGQIPTRIKFYDGWRPTVIVRRGCNSSTASSTAVENLCFTLTLDHLFQLTPSSSSERIWPSIVSLIVELPKMFRGSCPELCMPPSRASLAVTVRCTTEDRVYRRENSSDLEPHVVTAFSKSEIAAPVGELFHVKIEPGIRLPRPKARFSIEVQAKDAMASWTGKGTHMENVEKITLSEFTALPWELEAKDFEYNKYCGTHSGNFHFIRGLSIALKPVANPEGAAKVVRLSRRADPMRHENGSLGMQSAVSGPRFWYEV